MTCVKLDKIYTALSWKDKDGSIWYKHLNSLHFLEEIGWAVGAGQILRIDNKNVRLFNQAAIGISPTIIPERVITIDQQTAWVIMLSHHAGNNCYYTRN